MPAVSSKTTHYVGQRPLVNVVGLAAAGHVSEPYPNAAGQYCYRDEAGVEHVFSTGGDSLILESANNADTLIQFVEGGVAKFTAMNDASDDTFQLRAGNTNGEKLVEVSSTETTVKKLAFKTGGEASRCVWSSAGQIGTVLNTTTKTSVLPTGIGSLTIPASQRAEGRTVVLKASGTAMRVSGNTRMRVSWGTSGQVYDMFGQPSFSGWQLEFRFAMSSSAMGRISGQLTYYDSDNAKGYGDGGLINQSGDITFDLTATHSVADMENLVYLDVATLELLGA